MLYIRNKKSNNFSKEEVDFLNNFKSLEEFATFSVNFSGLIDKLNSNPALSYGILGALGGAGLGAGANLIVGDKKKSKLRKALEGAAIGGLLGGGAGAIGGSLVPEAAAKNIDNVVVVPEYPENVSDGVSTDIGSNVDKSGIAGGLVGGSAGLLGGTLAAEKLLIQEPLKRLKLNGESNILGKVVYHKNPISGQPGSIKYFKPSKLTRAGILGIPAAATALGGMAGYYIAE